MCDPQSPSPEQGKAMANNTTPKPITPRDVIKEVKDAGAEFLVNTKTEPVIFLPHTPFQQYWPAGHDRVQSYLAAVYHDLSKGGYKPQDQAAIIALLKEECYTGSCQLTELESPKLRRIQLFKRCCASQIVTKRSQE